MIEVPEDIDLERTVISKSPPIPYPPPMTDLAKMIQELFNHPERFGLRKIGGEYAVLKQYNKE